MDELNTEQLENNEDYLNIGDDDQLKQQLIEEGKKLLQNINFPIKYEQLYEWQQNMLINYILRDQLDKNILITAGTSSGKTFAISIFILKQLLILQKHVIMTVPYVSLVEELVLKFKDLLPSSVGLKALTGYKAVPQQVGQKPTLYLCTIEKSLQMLRLFVDQQQVAKLGLIVVDECHYMVDRSKTRPSMLECFLTSIISLQVQANIQTRIIAMSATIDNYQDFIEFLQADHVNVTNFRPCPLKETVFSQNRLYDIKSRQIIKTYTFNQQQDQFNQLIYDVNKPVLVFVETKSKCRELAQSYSQFISTKQEKKSQDIIFKLQNIYRQMGRGCHTFILSQVYFHNSDLTGRQRQIIEEGFKDGLIKVLFATTTLAAGVNLPTQTVIIHSLKVGIEKLLQPQYKQMVGRAGRTKSSNIAYSILYQQNRIDWNSISLLISQYYGKSQINDESNILNTALYLFNSVQDVQQVNINSNIKYEDMVRCTLFYVQNKNDEQKIQQFEQKLINIMSRLGQVLGAYKETNTGLQELKYGRAIKLSGISASNAIWLSSLLQTKQTISMQGSDIIYLYIIAPDEYIDTACQKYFESNKNKNMIEFKKLIRQNVSCPNSYIKVDSDQLASIDQEVFDILNIDFTDIQIMQEPNQVPLYMIILQKIFILKQIVEQYNVINQSKQQNQQKEKEMLQQILNSNEDTIRQTLSYSVYLVKILSEINYLLLLNAIKEIQGILQQYVMEDLTDLLQIQGVDTKIARRLKDAGYDNAFQIVVQGIDKLMLQFSADKSGILARQIYDSANKLVSGQL